MGETSTSIEQRIQQIQIARHFLDGADVEWVQSRFGTTVEETEAAWSDVVAMLEQSLNVPGSEISFFALPDTLSSQLEACLRLLLAWHEQYRQTQLIGEVPSEEPVTDDTGDE